MENGYRKSLTGILAGAFIIEAALLLWAYINYIQPVILKLSFARQAAIIAMLAGAFYYSISLIFFLLQPVPENRETGVVHIMGKPFKPGMNIYSPANHIIFATMIIIAGVIMVTGAV